MYRQFAVAALLTGTAFAAEIPAAGEAGDSPAVQLIRNGLSGTGNQLEGAGPSFKVTAGDLTLDFPTTTVFDVAAKLGGTPRHQGEGGDSFTWVCYVSPDATPVTVWFGSRDTGENTFAIDMVALDTVAPPETAGCTTLAAPLSVTSGSPMLGTSMADIETAFGPKPNVEDDGTIGYFFDSQNLPDGIGAITKMLKYRMVDGVAVAAGAGIGYELQ